MNSIVISTINPNVDQVMCVNWAIDWGPPCMDFSMAAPMHITDIHCIVKVGIIYIYTFILYVYIYVIYVYTVWIQFYVSLREATECAVFIGRSGCVNSIYHINEVFLHWRVLYKFYFDFISNMIIPYCIHRLAAKAAICLCFAQLWLYQEPCLQRIRSINIFAVDRKGLWCPSVPSIWCHTWCVTCPNLRNLVLGGCFSWFKCGLQCVCVI